MKINIIRCKDHAEVGLVTAKLVAEEIHRKPNLVLGLPTGKTPIPIYDELCKMHNEGKIDCKGVTTFNLDEYEQRGPGDPDSYCEFMHEYLFNHIPFKSSYLPNAKPASPTASGYFSSICKSCSEYDACIDLHGGIDLQIVGIGSNGHIGFNEPSEEISDGTCFVELTQQTISDNAKKFYNGNEDEVPKRAISMGMGKIMEAKSIILIANGESKANAINRNMMNMTFSVVNDFYELFEYSKIYKFFL